MNHELRCGRMIQRFQENGFSHNLELTGRSFSPSAEFRCKFQADYDDHDNSKVIGSLTLSSYMGNEDHPNLRPVFDAQVTFTTGQIHQISSSLKSAFHGPINATIVLQLGEIIDIEVWKNEFESNKYSPSIPILGTSLSIFTSGHFH